jgi:hypothetical protein
MSEGGGAGVVMGGRSLFRTDRYPISIRSRIVDQLADRLEDRARRDVRGRPSVDGFRGQQE